MILDAPGAGLDAASAAPMNKPVLALPILVLFSACGPVAPDETQDAPFVSPATERGAGPCSAMIGPSWVARFDYTSRQIDCHAGDTCVIVRLRLLADGSFRREVSWPTASRNDSVERSVGSYTLDCQVLMLLGCDGTVVEYSVDEISDRAWTGSGFQFHPASGTDAEQLSDHSFAALAQCS